ncbi:hypothetical protein [Comamonas jiangduensis]|uniref:hypothetical protein n=1 Tax=Comamonas jiangduensis TaxID=1194168 RepID=UPI0028AAE462|nr:hypothetical protein [Comamonas jiangduensis]
MGDIVSGSQGRRIFARRKTSICSIAQLTHLPQIFSSNLPLSQYGSALAALLFQAVVGQVVG